jgi:hypothetical protein
MEEEIQAPKQLIMDDYQIKTNDDTFIDNQSNYEQYNYKNILYYLCQFIHFKIN